MNRALAAADSTDSEPKRASAYGGLALTIGADAAYADGNSADGDRLIQDAAASVDLALGFVPVVSSINDAAQIIHGMVTGTDYAGRPMSAADYTLRGVGIVVGLLPVGAAVMVGGELLGRSFIDGCEFLKASGLRATASRALRGLREVEATATGAIGDLFWRANPDLKTLIELNNDANRTFHLFEGSRATLKIRGIKEFWTMMRDEGGNYLQEERLQFLHTFRTGIRYEVTETELIKTRWENASAASPGRLRFLGNEEISDANLARQRYAIPPQNRMQVLNEYRIKAGTGIFTGETAPNFSEPGGATQVFVTGSKKQLPESVVKIRTIIRRSP
jgi:hypothetical protein